MSGVLGTGLEAGQLMIFLLILVFGVIAIKVSFSFDINRFLENRQKARMQKIKNACPHFELTPLDTEIEVRSLFVSPPGTHQHQCRQCGLVTYLDIEQHGRQADFYLKNPDMYVKATKRFRRLLKKSGRA